MVLALRDWIENASTFCKTKLTNATADVIGWVGLVVLHASTIPNVLTVMAGVNDRMPPVDLVLFLWSGLALFFVRAAIRRDLLNLVTIGVGFIVHAVLLALLVFK